MFTVSCKDLATDCDFVGRADTEEDLMMQFVGHAVKMHEFDLEDVMTPEMGNKIRANIHEF